MGDTFVNIRRIDNTVEWDLPVHAINWFDTRQLQLYNFYNKLASRSVKAVGGVPVFKGTLLTKIHGADEDQRKVLLLVRYPSPDNFRRMVANTYFKVVSIIRTLAVKRFTFCLSHNIDEVTIPTEMEKSQNYAIHHFRGNAETVSLIKQSLNLQGIEVTFASMKTHVLSTKTGDKKEISIPALMDGMILFKCENADTLQSIIENDTYRASLSSAVSSYIGLYKRIM